MKCIQGLYPSIDTKSCVNCSKISTGCTKCTDVCFQCDTYHYYNSTLVNGKCVCKNAYF
jgi:hypothetical protein